MKMNEHSIFNMVTERCEHLLNKGEEVQVCICSCLYIDNPGVIFENITVHVISKISRETMLLLYTTTTNSLSQDYTNLDDHISQTSIDI